jgi:hypothetical protein
MIYWINGPPHFCRAGYAPGVRVAFAEEFASRGREEKIYRVSYCLHSSATISRGR